MYCHRRKWEPEPWEADARSTGQGKPDQWGVSLSLACVTIIQSELNQKSPKTEFTHSLFLRSFLASFWSQNLRCETSDVWKLHQTPKLLPSQPWAPQSLGSNLPSALSKSVGATPLALPTGNGTRHTTTQLNIWLPCLRKNKKLHRYINFNPPFRWYLNAFDLCPLIHKILSNVSWEQEWQPMVLNCSCRSSGPNWTFPVLYVKWIFCFIDKFTLQSQRLSSKKLQVF